MHYELHVIAEKDEEGAETREINPEHELEKQGVLKRARKDTKEYRPVSPAQKRNTRKYLWFLMPIQFPVQGQ